MVEYDICSVPNLALRAKADGIPASAYTIRRLIKEGKIPARYIGNKPLASYSAIVRYFSCEDGCDNSPATVAAAPGIRRVDLRGGVYDTVRNDPQAHGGMWHHYQLGGHAGIRHYAAGLPDHRPQKGRNPHKAGNGQPEKPPRRYGHICPVLYR